MPGPHEYTVPTPTLSRSGMDAIAAMTRQTQWSAPRWRDVADELPQDGAGRLLSVDGKTVAWRMDWWDFLAQQRSRWRLRNWMPDLCRPTAW